MHHLSLRSALAHAFQIPLRPAMPPATTRAALKLTLFRSLPSTSVQRTDFSSTSPTQARDKKRKGPGVDRRITLIRHFLHHPMTLTPRPLRFSRNRSLRHWTIRRAWSLFTSQRRQAQQLELEKQYNSMAAACEDLRTGIGDGGKLFRRAMMKRGVWSIPERGGGVPIEYTRGLSEWVGGAMAGAGGEEGKGKREGRVWDEGWTPLAKR